MLIFMSLPRAELSIERVRTRVALGGHHVPDDTVRRRSEEGLRNFFGRYREIVSRWYLYDNEGIMPILIAMGSEEGGARIEDPQRWTTMEERYGR